MYKLSSRPKIKKVIDSEIYLLGKASKVVIGGYAQGAITGLKVGLEYK